MVNFVEFFRLFVWLVVALFDLVHDKDAIFHIPYVLTAFGNLV